MPGLFIAGTNTEIGKTYVASLIARALHEASHKVGVYKPVASGCRREQGKLIAEDAEQLWNAASQPGEFDKVCPQCFELPVAPPQAAKAEGKQVDAPLLRSGLAYWQECSEIVLVEGAGGLMSPLSDEDYNIDLAADLGFPLVIVSANELGTINATLQTIITARVKAPQLPIAGIVLNQVSDRHDDSLATNAEDISAHADVPLLACVDLGAKRFPAEVDWKALAAGA